jgi:hypothetical protein
MSLAFSSESVFQQSQNNTYLQVPVNWAEGWDTELHTCVDTVTAKSSGGTASIENTVIHWHNNNY